MSIWEQLKNEINKRNIGDIIMTHDFSIRTQKAYLAQLSKIGILNRLNKCQYKVIKHIQSDYSSSQMVVDACYRRRKL